MQRCVDAVAGTDTGAGFDARMIADRGDDGRNPVQWARTLGRLALGHPDKSPFVKVTQGKKFRIRFDQKVLYELDGSARKASKKLRIKVHPGSVTVCVPPKRRA